MHAQPLAPSPHGVACDAWPATTPCTLCAVHRGRFTVKPQLYVPRARFARRPFKETAAAAPAAALRAARAAMGSGGSKARQADQDTSSKSQQDTEPITPPPTCCKHTYDSSEKPVRSSMRPSLDVAPNSISRRSMGTPTSVGFSVGQNAPDADGAITSMHPPPCLHGALQSAAVQQTTQTGQAQLNARPTIPPPTHSRPRVTSL